MDFHVLNTKACCSVRDLLSSTRFKDMKLFLWLIDVIPPLVIAQARLQEQRQTADLMHTVSTSFAFLSS